MEIDWTLVKKRTLWDYDHLIKKLDEVLNYDFVQEHYDHTLSEAVAFSTKVQRGYIVNGKEATFIADIRTQLESLGALGVLTYQDLIQRVESTTKCEAFIRQTGFPFEALIQVLGYLLRWVLPFKCPVRELLDLVDPGDHAPYDHLKKHKIRSNLDVIELFRLKRNRETFAKETGINMDFLCQLVHRADISRLAYVRGKTVKHLCGGGYDTLDKIAEADIVKMEADLTAYFASFGKRFSSFKNVIPLDWMIGGARILPKVVES